MCKREAAKELPTPPPPCESNTEFPNLSDNRAYL